MLIKICGIQNKKDLDIALLAGADLAGFIVDLKSSSSISPELVFNLKNKLTSRQSVLVTNLASINEVKELYQKTQTDYIQLHSELISIELLTYLKKKNIKVIQAISVVDQTAIKKALQVKDLVEFILLDSKKTDQPSELHDLSISAQISSLIPNKIILAGGLNPENVQEAIKQVGPVGVDVNSGLNNQFGLKDLRLAKQFINRAKDVN